jgi:hypothetical protein
MAINTSKVLVGGLVAGVIFIVTDFLTHGVLLADRMAAELGQAAPGAMERLETAGAMTVFIAMNLVFGIALAWLYAAIRPRFGPGMRTAAYAGVFMWIIASVMHSFFVVAGLMSASTFAIGAVIWLIALVLAAGAAGRLYTEEAPAGSPPAETFG